MSDNRRELWFKAEILPTDVMKGRFVVNVPFTPRHMAVLNSSGASLAVATGSIFQIPAEAMYFEPYIYLSIPVEERTQFTVFWESSSLLSDDNNSILLIFSDEPIPVQGGAMTTGGVAQNVEIVNTASVAVVNTPSVDVSSLPAVSGFNYDSNLPNNNRMKTDSDGNQFVVVTQDQTQGNEATGVNPLPGSSGILGWLSSSFSKLLDIHSSINSSNTKLDSIYTRQGANPAQEGTDATGVVPPSGAAGIRGWLSSIFLRLGDGNQKTQISAALPAGSNTIGKVDVNGGVLAATAGVSGCWQTTVGASSAPLINSNVGGVRQVVIQNNDDSVPLYIGNNTVNGSTGFPISPKGSFALDVVPNSFISIYGWSASNVNVSILTIA